MYVTRAEWTNRTNRMNQQKVFVGFLLDQQNFSVGVLLDQYTTFPIETNRSISFVGPISYSIGPIPIKTFCWFLLDQQKVPVEFLLDQQKSFYWISSGPTGSICWILLDQHNFSVGILLEPKYHFPYWNQQVCWFYWSNILLEFRPGLVTALRLWYPYRMSHFTHTVPLLLRCCPTLPTGWSTSPQNKVFLFINCRILRTVPPQLMALYVTYHMNLLASSKENVIISSIKRYKMKISVLYPLPSHFSPLSLPCSHFTGFVNCGEDYYEHDFSWVYSARPSKGMISFRLHQPRMAILRTVPLLHKAVHAESNGLYCKPTIKRRWKHLSIWLS